MIETIPEVTNGPMGWGLDDHTTIDQRHNIEKRHFDRIAADCPICFRARPIRDFMPTMVKAFNEFQESKGLFPGSCDMTLLDEFLFGKRFHWRSQDIGSCVQSNTFRGCVRNFMAEITLRGDPEEFFGRDEFGPKNIAFYGPTSYGWMRKRGGLTGRGDGGFCGPMIETLMKDGVVMCSTPKLLSLLGNGYPANHFPEPIGNPGLYRAIGDGRYLAELLPYTTCRMMNSERVTSADKFLEVSRKFNAIIQCSGIAIKKAGTHKDGFDFHVQNQSDSWAHNMAFHGFRVASDGKIFGRLSNESWGNDVIYNVPIEEIDRWHTRNLTESQSLGDFDQAKSVPVISPVIP